MPIRPLHLCADGGYQLRLGVLGVPLIMVPDKICVWNLCMMNMCLNLCLNLLLIMYMNLESKYESGI
jgi:hypothetical protein